MILNKIATDIWTIPQFFSLVECEDFIKVSEHLGYEQATVETGNGPQVIKALRNNYRLIYTSLALSEKLWEKVSSFVPQRIGNSQAIGLNEMVRFYKYQAGQEFKKHRDQSYIRNEWEASYYTFMIYLNDDYIGGETYFGEASVIPQTGTALIFKHQLEHSGNKVSSGVKYVLRTDVMYRLEN